ncbi:MAG: CotH kinase family protein [Myxococcales bacterium]|nr:CotH kinase family protein [Myxococcales bacterium]
MNKLTACLHIFFLTIALVGCAGGEPDPNEGTTNKDGGSTGGADGGSSDGGGPGYFMTDVSSPDAAPWPLSTDTSLPSCKPWSDAWVLPPQNVKNKGLKLKPSAVLQPLGAEETIEVKIYDKAGKHDTKAAGKLTVKTPVGVTVVHTQEVKAGRADIIVKVTKEGAHNVTATFTNGETGSVDLFGFTSQLPVWRIDVDPADLAKIYADPNTKIWIPAALIIDGKTRKGKMRLHGGSSRTFKKKSFRLNLDKDQRMPDGRRKLVLRAEFVDKSQVRSFVAYEVMRHGTWLASSRLMNVHLRLGARYHGVMLHPERIDSHFLKDRGWNKDGSLYEADPPFAKSVPGGNLTVPKNKDDYPDLYQEHEGKLDYKDLIELIEVVLQLPDDEFEQNADRIIKTDDILVALALFAVTQNQDWVKKNYYLYRDPKATDSRWTIIPWDLDLSLGHLWTEENDVFDENIFTDGNPYVGMNNGTLFYNQLADRLLSVKRFRQRYRAFIAHLIEGRFNTSFLAARIDNTMCRMQPDILADKLKRAKNEELLSRVQEVKDFITGRRTWLKTWLAEPDTKK